MTTRLGDIPGVHARTLYDGKEHTAPHTELTFDPETEVDAHELVLAMENAEPRIFLFEPNGPTALPNSIIINTMVMQPGEERVIVEALRPALLERVGLRATTR